MNYCQSVHNCTVMFIWAEIRRKSPIWKLFLYSNLQIYVCVWEKERARERGGSLCCVMRWQDLYIHEQFLTFRLSVCVCMCTCGSVGMASCLTWLPCSVSRLVRGGWGWGALRALPSLWIFIAVLGKSTKIKYSFSSCQIHPLNTTDLPFASVTFTSDMKGKSFCSRSLRGGAFFFEFVRNVCVCEVAVNLHLSVTSHPSKVCWVGISSVFMALLDVSKYFGWYYAINWNRLCPKYKYKATSCM